MDVENNDGTVTLIYYNFRGMAQTIRYILFYLNVPFKEILLNPGQQPSSLGIIKKPYFPGQVELPCLIDGKYLIQECFAIIKYLCTKAKREDLLGSNLEERTLIKQIFYNYMLKKKKVIKVMFKFGEETMAYPCKKQEIRKQAMQYVLKESGSLPQLITIKLKNPQQRYLMDHLTVLDFLFYEQSFYHINLFGSLEEKNCKFLDTLNSIFGTDWSNVKDKCTLYLRVMREFKENFEKEQFYQANKEKLQSYTVLSPSMGKIAREGFKKVWLGPQHFIM